MSSDFDDEKQHAMEVIPGLILGSYYTFEEILFMKPDVLFPLDRAPGYIWKRGFRGEIVYYPITDYDILPDDVLDRLVDAVVERLRAGKRVGMFCIGGHGRTGYVASCVLHRFGIKRPVYFLRDKYSYKAVETNEQMDSIAEYIERHPMENETAKTE